MLEIFLQFDQRITQVIYQLFPHNIFFDYLFSFFSLKGGSIAIWIVIVLFLFIFEGKRHHKFIISFCVATLITAIIVNFGIKNIVRRPRPSTKISNFKFQISNCPTDFSFPSGHASTAFAAATVIAFYDKKRKWGYYLIAVLISLSRIYLGCHYFLDILIGGIIGYLISIFLLRFLYKKITKLE